MKEHPILFSTEMVKAILEGRKTQTRRVISKQPSLDCTSHNYAVAGKYLNGEGLFLGDRVVSEPVKCPYGQPGDHLWVRETFISGWPVDGGVLQDCDENGNELPQKVWYRADGEDFQWMQDDGSMTYRIPWKPSIHMPRWASRITLEITGIRVERVQEISERDAADEGVIVPQGTFEPIGWVDGKLQITGPRQIITARHMFMGTWDAINEKRGYGWDVNPWVWVIEFRKGKG